jgi:cytochrome c-type biogenesis protein CcmE
VELSPRTLDDPDAVDALDDGGAGADAERARPRRRTARRARRRWLPLALFAVALLGIGALAYKGLSDASLYFRNADEAVAQRDSLGTTRFRLQGTVAGEPVESGDTLRFAVVFNDVSVDVEHQGSPPDLFRPGIPVVIEGHWQEGSDVFAGDRILVKHDESYESKDDYETRTSQAEQGGR